MTATGAAERRAGGSARVLWAQVTVTGALIVTAFDAFLLQQSKAFFTGGFLTAVYTRTGFELGLFLAASLLVDAASVGLAAAVLLWLTARLPLAPPARRLMALGGAVAPLIVVDFVSYRLLSYLGDAFDLGLMFDLAGRQPKEFLAVAAGHLWLPLLVAGCVGCVAGALIWAVHRRAPGTGGPLRRTVATLAIAATLFATGIAATAAASTASEVLEDGLARKPSGRVARWLADALSDLDRDGFGSYGSLRDPQPFDAAVYPYALDRPGNGIDENGVGGDLPSELPPYDEDAPPPRWEHRPNLVLVVLESFRADAVGRSIDGRAVTPVLDALGRRGISATAFSHNGYTAQSRYHLFSGSLAGLRRDTLIDDFKANGYEVAYFSGQDESFGGEKYAVGFQRADVAYDARQDRKRRYSSFATAGSLAVPFDVVVERLEAFLARRDAGRPLFLYVNLHETHYPYHRRGLESRVSADVLGEAEIRPDRAAALQRMYYNTASNVDAAIGRVLALLGERLGAQPAVIVSADHGESLFDAGFLGHGYALNDEQTRIPMIAAGLPLRITEPFGQIELRNAIAAALAVPDGAEQPSVVSVPGGRVFQYLGKIERPRQIGFAGPDWRTIYDFRTRKVRVRNGAWTTPDSLVGESKREFLDLVHTWERMMVAGADGVLTAER